MVGCWEGNELVSDFRYKIDSFNWSDWIEETSVLLEFLDEGNHSCPVTVIEAGPCYVTQIKTSEKEGYSAIQVGYDEIKEHKLNKPKTGHLKKMNNKYLRYIVLHLGYLNIQYYQKM